MAGGHEASSVPYESDQGRNEGTKQTSRTRQRRTPTQRDGQAGVTETVNPRLGAVRTKGLWRDVLTSAENNLAGTNWHCLSSANARQDHQVATLHVSEAQNARAPSVQQSRESMNASREPGSMAGQVQAHNDGGSPSISSDSSSERYLSPLAEPETTVAGDSLCPSFEAPIDSREKAPGRPDADGVIELCRSEASWSAQNEGELQQLECHSTTASPFHLPNSCEEKPLTTYETCAALAQHDPYIRRGQNEHILWAALFDDNEAW